MSGLYPWVLWLHVLGAVILFGTGLGTAFHMWMTHLRGDLAAIATTARNVVFADWLFTATAGVLQPLTGMTLIYLGGFDPVAPWLLISYALYLLALGCWLPVVWLQLRVRDMAIAAMARKEPLPERYYRYMRYWFMLGWPAFIALLVVFWLMVAKRPF